MNIEKIKELIMECVDELYEMFSIFVPYTEEQFIKLENETEYEYYTRLKNDLIELLEKVDSCYNLWGVDPTWIENELKTV